MSTSAIHRDERTATIENAGYRWSYLFLSFGLLILVAWRSLVNKESSGDLLALVILAGGVNAGYQYFHRVLYRRWLMQTLITMVVAALLAAVVFWARTHG